MKLLKAEREVNQQVAGEEFKCYINLANDGGAMLHSNGKLRTEGWRQRKDVKVCSTAEDY